MLVNDPTLFKFLTCPKESVQVGDYSLYLIPQGVFTAKEIERLRELEEWSIELGDGSSIANFLPDSIRPKNVPKM